jgi:hypothetical protein
MLGLSLLQWLITILLLVGIALPFLQIAHPRHARAFMGALIGFTSLWWFLNLLMRNKGMLGEHQPLNSDTVLLRSYVFSVALCSLLEEVLSMRNEGKEVRSVILTLSILFFVGTLICLVGGVFGAF